MPIVLFDPELAITRISGEVAGFVQVGEAADLPAAIEDLKRPPAAFVVPLRDLPGRNLTGTEVVVQRNVARFGVVMAAQNLRDATGRQAGADLLTLRLALLAALVGWRPNVDYDVFEYAGGHLLQLQDRVLWWQDDFLTVTDIRSV